jgi:hypothetical protein
MEAYETSLSPLLLIATQSMDMRLSVSGYTVTQTLFGRYQGNPETTKKNT